MPKRRIFWVLGIFLWCLLFLAETPLGKDFFLDWSHHLQWANMIWFSWRWGLFLLFFILFLFFWCARREYHVNRTVCLVVILSFSSVTGSIYFLRERVIRWIDLPELFFATVLLMIGLFFKLGNIGCKKIPFFGIIFLMGGVLEPFELLFPGERFFTWIDFLINPIAILLGYSLISYDPTRPSNTIHYSRVPS